MGRYGVVFANGRRLASSIALLCAALLCAALLASCSAESPRHAQTSDAGGAAAEDDTPRRDNEPPQGEDSLAEPEHDGGAQQADSSIATTCAPSADLVGRVSPARILADLNALTAFERTSSQGQYQAAQYLESALARFAGVKVREQLYSYAGASYYNIEATIAGSASPGRIVFAGAHYDCMEGVPGADDNASGTVAVLEAARVLADCHPLQSIRLVWFSNEEAGFIGSTTYVNALPPERLSGALILDMVAYARPDEDLDLGTRLDYQAFAEETKAAVEQWTPLKVNLLVQSFRGDTDVKPFWDAGYAALFASEQPPPGYGSPVNPNYHTPDDTVSTLDQAFLANVTRGLVAALATLAQQP